MIEMLTTILVSVDSSQAPGQVGFIQQLLASGLDSAQGDDIKKVILDALRRGSPLMLSGLIKHLLPGLYQENKEGIDHGRALATQGGGGQP